MRQMFPQQEIHRVYTRRKRLPGSEPAAALAFLQVKV